MTTTYPAPVNPSPVMPSAVPLVETAATPVAEAGFRTTEFWITIATTLIALLTMFHLVSFTSDQTQAILGMIGLVVPQAFYALSRGVRKSGAV